MNWSDEVEVFNEDCMVTMSRYPDNYFDLAIVDPPYGLGYSNKPARQRFDGKEWDNHLPNQKYFDELFRVSKEQIIWGGNYFIELWQTPCKGFIFWDKSQPVNNFADGEFAWTSFDVPAKCFRFRYFGNIEGNTLASKRIHPTQKPRSLYKWLLSNYAQPDFKILDTHLGGGNHAIESHFFGIAEFVGCEIETDYFNDSFKHFKEQISQQVLF